MRAALFTFSGTGNTMRAAAMLRDSFESLGAAAEIYDIEKIQGEMPDLSQADMIGIGYPIYAFNPPKLVLDFVRRLPCGNGRSAFIFKTAGEPFYWNDSSSALLMKHLRKNGYRVVFERHFLMPYNIVFRYPDALAKQMLLINRKLCMDMAQRILQGEVSLPKLTLQSRLASFVFRIQWPGAALNGRLCRVGKRCNLCGKCERNCPVGNIRRDKGKIRFGWKCIMCMRCVMYCPKDAIRFGLLRRWSLNGPYEFDRIMTDETIPEVFVREDTQGFFRLFRKYYRWADEVTKSGGASQPE